ncbi:11988_t:CDS:2, partial [Diversispora eburnea]
GCKSPGPEPPGPRAKTDWTCSCKTGPRTSSGPAISFNISIQTRGQASGLFKKQAVADVQLAKVVLRKNVNVGGEDRVRMTNKVVRKEEIQYCHLRCGRIRLVECGHELVENKIRNRKKKWNKRVQKE